MKISLFSEITLDGKLTISKQSSKEMLTHLTELENELIQKFRQTYDGILVGSKTIKEDNPFLTCRTHPNQSPVRIILSNRLDFTFQENIFKDHVQTIVVTRSKDQEKRMAIKAWGKTVLEIPDELEDEEVVLKYILQRLEDEYGIKTLLVEGGGTVNWQFVRQNLFDEIHLLQLPIIAGGAETVTLVDGLGFSEVSCCPSYKLISVTQFPYTLYCQYVKIEEEDNESASLSTRINDSRSSRT